MKWALQSIWLVCIICAPAQVITTVAGTIFTFPSSPLPAINAPLGQVTGVASDGRGNIYAADTLNNLVVRISADGILTVVAGNGTAGFSGDGGPATSAALNSPHGVAVDASGNLYIADTSNSRIRKVSGGIVTTVAGGGSLGDGAQATSAAISFPEGVAVDSAGNLFIADTGGNRIRIVSAGIITTVAGNGTAGFSGDTGLAVAAKLSNPRGVAVDSAGNMFIADSANHRIRRVSGGIITTIAGNGVAGSLGDRGTATSAMLNTPVGLGFDAGGNLLIADSVNYRIRRVSAGNIETVVGSGTLGFSGDGGPALSATLNIPTGVAVDSSGALVIADSLNDRIRRVSGGLTATMAGNGSYKFSGDGGPATSAALNGPFGVALDSGGNLYIADAFNARIRKVSKGIVTTVAGKETSGSAGDGGPATQAMLRTPLGVAVDSNGNLYIADFNNSRVRKVSGGNITTVAGNGTPGFSGDGGSATAAGLNLPAGVAVDAAGNLFIADTANHRIRRVSGGTITTVAGNGTSGFSGDGGPATSAALNGPYGVAVDSSGNIYIADTGNNRIRKISGGNIATVAGNGTAGLSGDGGPAIGAALNSPHGVAVDGAGNVFIADTGKGNSRIRKVSGGTITTVAGGGSSGDGALATSAALTFPEGVAVDSAGNLFIADTGADRVRNVPSAPASFQASPAALSFAASSGGAVTTVRVVSLSPSTPGLAYSATTNVSWLSIAPSSGSMPASLQVAADPAQLAPGNYSGIITITSPSTSPSTQPVAVSFAVGATAPGILSLSNTSFAFSFTQSASPGSQQLTLSNRGSGSIHYTAAASTTSGGNWLSITPAGGNVAPASPAALTVMATPGSLDVGTYAGTLTIASPDSSQQISIPVTMAISAPPQKILLSQAGFTFTAVAQGGTVLPQRLGILNAGSGTLNYTIQTKTISGGSGWLGASAFGGTVARPFLDVSFVDISVDASALAPGDYSGLIQVTAAGASNSPQSALVRLTVLQAGSNPGPDVRPTGMVFTGATGASPGSQAVTVANVTGSANTFGSSVNYVGTGGWLTYRPTNATVAPNLPEQIVVQPDFTSLAAGPHRAAITLIFDDGTTQAIDILAVVGPAGSSNIQEMADGERLATGCTATKLLPQFAQVGFGSTPAVGFPVALMVKIVDDCAVPMTSGSVTASFDNGDAPLALISLPDGTWTATWQPQHASANVTVTVDARAQGMAGQAKSQSLAISASLASPLLFGGPFGAATLTEGPFAPGDLLLIRGTGLADGPASATSTTQQLAGASLTIGGSPASLLYADAGQIVGVIPVDVPVNTQPQLVVQHGARVGLPSSIIVATTHPAVLTKDGSGRGQGLIYDTSGGVKTLADGSNPAKAGDPVVIYCAGLGLTAADGTAINTPLVSIGGQPAFVSYAGVALTQDYPSGVAPSILGGLTPGGFGGLYQITTAVPGGLASGSAEVIINSAGQSSPGGVTLTAAGGAAANAPAITSIRTAGGFPDITQNGWIEIKGTNLAPPSVGDSGMTWDNAPEFLSGRMPTQLGGVSVAVNGKLAFVFFVSPTQVNVLTPLDGANGPVQVVVSSNGTPSLPVTVSMQFAAPSFPLFGGSYIVATHADYTLVGPASLSAPGFPVAPAQPGEVILLFGFGFGLPSAGLVNGSSSQTGTLPANPMIQIGGVQADVLFAGVISPGLYQFNVTVPATVADGDNPVVANYNGLTSPSGDLLYVQR